jgi:hypothetical protein
LDNVENRVIQRLSNYQLAFKTKDCLSKSPDVKKFINQRLKIPKPFYTITGIKIENGQLFFEIDQSYTADNKILVDRAIEEI